jgi:hypothetical protein
MEIDISNNILHDKPKILLLSSLFFVSNILTAYYCEYYVYSFLFFILTITSLIVHYEDNYYTNVIDRIAVSSIVLYGGHVLLNKMNTKKLFYCFIIVITFLICIYLYIYGFIFQKYCFCDEKSISQKYHFIMHIIASIGHHFIIYL